jgi:hypothetical protein
MAPKSSLGNPWLTIWTQPRSTVAAIVRKNPRYRLWVLSWLHGMPVILHFWQNMTIGTKADLFGTVLIGVLLSFVVGILGITIGSALIFWTGKLIGGQAPFTNVRAAVAWSNVPNIVTVATWILLFAVFKREAFNLTPLMAGTPPTGQYMLVLSVQLVQLIASIWSIVILVKGVAQVQGFSGWKGLLNVFLPILLLIALATLTVFLIAFFSQKPVS